MRVAHVVRQYLPSLGGLEEVVRNLTQQQLKQGLTPYIVTLNRIFKDQQTMLPAIEYIDGVQIIRIPYVGSSRYPIALSVLKHLKSADIVHVHAIDFFYDFLALTKFLHLKPLVVSTHGGFFHSGFASRLKKIYFKTITKLSSLAYSKVIGCSDNDGEMFSQIISPKRLCVIENGVDIEKFNNAASDTLKPVLIYFGRWSSNKGLLEALQVLSTLKKQHPTNPWRMIICGRAYDLTESGLHAYASDFDVSDALEVISNPSNDLIKQKIAESSFYICLSKHEGFGIAPIEAMSAGLYPILSDIPPFKKLVTQTNIAKCYAETEQIQMVNDLVQFFEKPVNTKNEIIASIHQYAWPHVAESYLNEYRKIK